MRPRRSGGDIRSWRCSSSSRKAWLPASAGRLWLSSIDESLHAPFRLKPEATQASRGLGAFPAGNHEQGDAADNGECAEDRRQGNGLPRLGGGFDWPDIEDLFALRIGNPSVEQRDDAE